jgi:membrane-bound serine protease (ClpP class)
VARERLAPEGLVLVQGELWRAVAQGAPVEPGETVRVVSVNGLTLNVVKPQDGGAG